MDRGNCGMSHWINNVCYCDYYDFGCFRCEDVEKCPAGCDEEDEDYDDEDLNEEDLQED